MASAAVRNNNPSCASCSRRSASCFCLARFVRHFGEQTVCPPFKGLPQIGQEGTTDSVRKLGLGSGGVGCDIGQGFLRLGGKEFQMRQAALGEILWRRLVVTLAKSRLDRPIGSTGLCALEG